MEYVRKKMGWHFIIIPSGILASTLQEDSVAESDEGSAYIVEIHGQELDRKLRLQILQLPGDTIP